MASADSIHRSVQRTLTGSQRLAIAADMSMAARELFFARLRQQHPEWSERRLIEEWVRQVHGIDLAGHVRIR